MYRTVNYRISGTKGDLEVLRKTILSFNDATNHIIDRGYQNRWANRFQLHRETYYDTRKKFPSLNAGNITCSIQTASCLLKRCRFKRKPIRGKYSAVPLTKKLFRLRTNESSVSISTIEGRRKFSIGIADYHQKFSDWTILSARLMYDKNRKTFDLGVIVYKEEPEKRKDESILGIDRGLYNIAVTSENQFFRSEKVNSIRCHYAYHRRTLQAKGTRSAKRKLRKMVGRERRFIACINHSITKYLADSDRSIFVLENLCGIRDGRKMFSDQLTRITRWAFFQFQWMLEYKAIERGKQVVLVNPYNTSKKCSKCGFVSSSNRNGSQFACGQCGFKLNADLNAARNITQLGKSLLGRLPVSQPNAPRDEGLHSSADSGVAERRCKTFDHDNANGTGHDRLGEMSNFETSSSDDIRSIDQMPADPCCRGLFGRTG